MGERGRATGASVTPSLTVAVPVLRRPDRVPVVAQRFSNESIELLFLPDPDDETTIAALDEHGLAYSFAPAAPAFGVPTYATKINHAYRVSTTPFLLYASDDVVPQAGWLPRALHALLGDERVGVLATNDMSHALVRRGKLATHGIVRRAYVERHGSASLPDAGPIMFEGYRHWGVDCEVSYVARARGAFQYASRVVLRHDHPLNRRGVMDDTYRVARSMRAQDRALRDQRLPGWPGVPKEGYRGE
jgi:hypothetical protein